MQQYQQREMHERQAIQADMGNTHSAVCQRPCHSEFYADVSAQMPALLSLAGSRGLQHDFLRRLALYLSCSSRPQISPAFEAQG